VRRDQLFAEGIAQRAKALGDDHPDTSLARWYRGGYSVRFGAAIDILAMTCPKLEAHDRLFAKRCWSEVGYLRGELNDRAGAAEAMQRAASIEVTRAADLPAALPYLHFWQGNAADASREFAVALRALPVREFEPWWDRLDRADLVLGSARADEAAGRLGEARRSLDVAVRQLVDINSKNPCPDVDRRLGRARAELAKILSATHAPARDIARHAAPAAAWLRRAGGSPAEIDELERLAASHGRPNYHGRSQ
jgi:hypothetical protein